MAASSTTRRTADRLTGRHERIQDRANGILAGEPWATSAHAYPRALAAATTHRHDYVGEYVNDLGSVVDLPAVRGARLSLCADALGGAGVAYWGRIAERYGLNLTIAHGDVDPTFRFMRVDWDGKIRMDCSSPYAMAGLIALKDKFDWHLPATRPTVTAS
jgi:phosphoglucomutase